MNLSTDRCRPVLMHFLTKAKPEALGLWVVVQTPRVTGRASFMLRPAWLVLSPLFAFYTFLVYQDVKHLWKLPVHMPFLRPARRLVSPALGYVVLTSHVLGDPQLFQRTKQIAFCDPSDVYDLALKSLSRTVLSFTFWQHIPYSGETSDEIHTHVCLLDFDFLIELGDVFFILLHKNCSNKS